MSEIDIEKEKKLNFCQTIDRHCGLGCFNPLKMGQLFVSVSYRQEIGETF